MEIRFSFGEISGFESVIAGVELNFEESGFGVARGGIDNKMSVGRIIGGDRENWVESGVAGGELVLEKLGWVVEGFGRVGIVVINKSKKTNDNDERGNNDKR